MARVGVSIEKRVAFRGVQQPFANVYHYEVAGLPTPAEAASIINEIVTEEKLLHSTDVTFVLGRMWSAGGTKETNQMINEVSLSGTGSNATSPSLDKERALLVQWPAGFDVRGRPVKLRKWYHLCGAYPASSVPGSGETGNTGEIPAVERTSIANIADRLRGLPGPSFTYELCAASGRKAQGPATCFRYLEHHQLGDQWRV